MDYLRTLGSAAVSQLVQKSGLNLPFTLGEKVEGLDNKIIWTLHDATKRDDSTPVSVFSFDVNQPGQRNLLPLAKNALRRLRTIRHPDVLKFMDVVETETTILIMTERVRPLGSVLQVWQGKGAKEREEWIIWGLHRVSVALAFINESASSTHGNVRVDSVFISPSGEWKIGGFEVLSSPKDEASVLYTLGGLVPDSTAISPPEVRKSGWSVLKDGNVAAADGYALGILLHTTFNPTHPLPSTTAPPTASQRGAIPSTVFPLFKRLLNPNAKARLTPQAFLEIGMGQTGGEGSGFFANNHLVKVCSSLDNFSLGSEAEKAALLKSLRDSAASFPPEFATKRVLPSLITALEFGGASAATILPLVLQFGKNVAPSDYAPSILGPIIKLYASPDRGIRMALLEHLPEYADKLDNKTVTDKIWPHLQTGFSDTVAVIREATLKSIDHIYPKLSDRVMNNDLLRQIARMQMDPEASIRTNSCILIGHMVPSLSSITKRKVLVPAFARALKDPFVHARVAGLMAFMATIEYFDVDDVAGKVVPSIATAAIDKEKLVRDQAFKALQLFIKKLEKHAESMPVTAINPDAQGPTPPLTGPGAAPPSLVNTATGAAGAIAGWAFSSIGKQLLPGEMQTAMATNGAPGTLSAPATVFIDRPTSAPPPLNATVASSSRSTHPATALPSPATSGGFNTGLSKAKGMQLGANKLGRTAGSSSIAALVAAAAAEADAESVAAAWGEGDLMDVNADEDDWTAFESAPVAPKPVPAVGLGLGRLQRSMTIPARTPADDDAWGNMDGTSGDADSSADLWGTDASITYPTLSQTKPAPTHTPMVPKPHPAIISASSQVKQTTSIASSQATPVGSSSPSPVTSPAQSMVTMTKEEKAAEMARRKEERKQRIAQLKEQKKAAGGGS